VVSSKTVSAAENKMPIASYLSGHMGRTYIGLPEGEGRKTLEWIGDRSTIAPRFAATHAGEIKDRKVYEKKLSPITAFIEGVRGIIGNRTHYGMDVAIGGKGNKYDGDSSKTIRDDGTSGHMYLTLMLVDLVIALV